MTTADPAPLIRLRSPRDVLATVPRLLGYRPRRSIVFLNLHDRAGVSTMRIDLPEPSAELVERRFITSIVGMLCKVPDIRQLIVVVYADGCFAAGGDVPRASFVRPLIQRLLRAGFEVHDALCVADDGWGAYDGHDAGEVHPLDELEQPAPGDDGTAPVADGVDDLTRLPPVGELARRGFVTSLERAMREREVFRPVEEAEEALAFDPSRASSDELAGLLTLLLWPEFRDAVLYTWAWGSERGFELLDVADRIAEGEIGPGDDTIALDLMGLRPTDRPDEQRIGRAIRLVSRLAALAPAAVAHVPLTVLAWLHWSQGRGSVAGRFVDAAREHDPSYGLAELLQTVLAQGMLPEWAYLRPGR
ncbi:DUF4192 family protein [Gryllotalpicola ginsengisoli]|uniref:DUF4192 family protein n=1 Tax=Gryllotalpicola ginsengisoli TaxID=444608 RepID=UPI00138B0485|nr:DUF4192 family protein [Gryllotalpicola ginsengisoli]